MMQETGALCNRLASPRYDTMHGLQILKVDLQEAFDNWKTPRLRVTIQKFITVHRGPDPCEGASPATAEHIFPEV